MTELAKNCSWGELEAEVAMEVLITNLRKVKIQKNSVSNLQLLKPCVLVHEKGS